MSDDVHSQIVSRWAWLALGFSSTLEFDNLRLEWRELFSELLDSVEDTN